MPQTPPNEPGLHDRVRGSLDGVPGGFGVVAAPGRRSPPEGAVGELVDRPPGLLLEPVIMTALRAAVTQACPAARFVGGVVLEVALGGGPSAHGAGTGRVPDLGQVPPLDPGAPTGAGSRGCPGCRSRRSGPAPRLEFVAARCRIRRAARPGWPG